MAHRNKYGQYLWDVTCSVPLRSKHRFKQKAAVAIREDDDAGQKLLREFPEPVDSGSEAAPSNVSTGSDAAIDTVSAVADAVNAPSDSAGDVSSATSGSISDSSDETDDDACAPQHKDPGEDTSTESSYLDQPIYPGARITAGESVLMVMAHSLRHDTSKEATESMLKVIEAHLPKDTAFPTTQYKFF